MKYEQLVEPDLNQSEDAGMCLQWSRKAFGAPKKEDTAHEALLNTTAYWDRDFPEDVSVPVWFEWWGTIKWSDGISRFMRYDHVAVRHKSGIVYSSPLRGRGRSTFTSVDELAKAFGNGMKYLAWSEDISGVKVIKKKEEEETMNESTVKAGYQAVFNRPPESEEAWKYWVGKKPFDMFDAFMSSNEYKQKNDIILRAYPELQKKVDELQSQKLDEKTKQIIADMQATIDKYKGGK